MSLAKYSPMGEYEYQLLTKPKLRTCRHLSSCFDATSEIARLTPPSYEQPSVEKTSSNAMTLTWSAEKLPLIFTQHIQLFEKERYALTHQCSLLSAQMESATTTGNLALLSKLYREMRKITQKSIALQAQADAYTPEDFIRDHPEFVSKSS